MRQMQNEKLETDQSLAHSRRAYGGNTQPDEVVINDADEEKQVDGGEEKQAGWSLF